MVFKLAASRLFEHGRSRVRGRSKTLARTARSQRKSCRQRDILSQGQRSEVGPRGCLGRGTAQARDGVGQIMFVFRYMNWSYLVTSLG
jgi:hypothetical protein